MCHVFLRQKEMGAGWSGAKKEVSGRTQGRKVAGSKGIKELPAPGAEAKK